MALNTAEYMLIEQYVENETPDTATAYLLWFFLGWASGHRWYLGRPGSAVLQIISYMFVVGFVWWVVDGFLIPGMIREKREELRWRMMTTMTIATAARA
jgi:TM2 domain-containing membrane protein YozV